MKTTVIDNAITAADLATCQTTLAAGYTAVKACVKVADP